MGPSSEEKRPNQTQRLRNQGIVNNVLLSCVLMLRIQRSLHKQKPSKWRCEMNNLHSNPQCDCVSVKCSYNTNTQTMSLFHTFYWWKFPSDSPSMDSLTLSLALICVTNLWPTTSTRVGLVQYSPMCTKWCTINKHTHINIYLSWNEIGFLDCSLISTYSFLRLVYYRLRCLFFPISAPFLSPPPPPLLSFFPPSLSPSPPQLPPLWPS